MSYSKVKQEPVIKKCTILRGPEGASNGKQQTGFKRVLVKVNKKPVLREF